MRADFDVIVVGGGAGGGTFAYQCARSGKSVLLIERGGRVAAGPNAHDERATLIEKRPYDDRTVSVNGVPRRLYVGGGLGGGTALYGAALMRPSAGDFHPGRYYGWRFPRAAWDWPITYDDLEPYYTEAERLYAVAGRGGDDFGPLGKPRDGFPHDAPPLHPINRRLMAANEARGLKPFRLPLAIDFRRCLRCPSCAGYPWPTGARRSSAQLLENAANGQDHARPEILTDTEAVSFCKDGRGQVNGVSVRERTTGQQSVYRARRYVLAAGAVRSPALLLRSELGGPLVGRHYMFHLAPVVAGVFAQPTGADRTFAKQVGFADYYFGTAGFADKLGVIQSLPVPGPLMMGKVGGARVPAGVIQQLRARMLPLMGLVEDLPDARNRVTLDRDGNPEIRHAFSAYDRERGRRLARLMRQILKSAGALLCLSRPFPSDEHVSHQCGTLRFGRRPAEGACDPDGRLFGQPNVFVVDGSVFPTSLGVGPALTIIANALRVAGVVAREV
jgi:choline dehydrogenase-like flavoprotein